VVSASAGVAWGDGHNAGDADQEEGSGGDDQPQDERHAEAQRGEAVVGAADVADRPDARLRLRGRFGGGVGGTRSGIGGLGVRRIARGDGVCGAAAGRAVAGAGTGARGDGMPWLGGAAGGGGTARRDRRRAVPGGGSLMGGGPVGGSRGRSASPSRSRSASRSRGRVGRNRRAPRSVRGAGRGPARRPLARLGGLGPAAALLARPVGDPGRSAGQHAGLVVHASPGPDGLGAAVPDRMPVVAGFVAGGRVSLTPSQPGLVPGGAVAVTPATLQQAEQVGHDALPYRAHGRGAVPAHLVDPAGGTGRTRAVRLGRRGGRQQTGDRAAHDDRDDAVRDYPMRSGHAVPPRVSTLGDQSSRSCYL
jgi:hypothetical protein